MWLEELVDPVLLARLVGSPSDGETAFSARVTHAVVQPAPIEDRLDGAARLVGKARYHVRQLKPSATTRNATHPGKQLTRPGIQLNGGAVVDAARGGGAHRPEDVLLEAALLGQIQ